MSGRTLAGFFRLDEWPGRVILALFTLSNTVNTLATLNAVRSPVAAVAALILATAGAVLLLLPTRSSRYPRAAAYAVVLIVVGLSLASWNLPASGWPGWASWNWFASTLLLIVLVLRGRVLAAWIGFALHVLLVFGWVAQAGRPLIQGVEFVVHHAVLLVVFTVFSSVLRRTMRSIAQVEQAHLELVSSRAWADAAAGAREERVARVTLAAGDLLEILSADTPLTDQHQRECLLAEATIRDVLRGGVLASDDVLAAARDARLRHVTVQLLDDGGPSRPDGGDLERMHEAACAALERADDGTLTIRRLPPGRPQLATIRLATAGRAERLDVPARTPQRDVAAT
ncbi:hypothetical protein IM660_03225 [Ruania alkalisoli]|uniref:Uncharacterized protein n=1 Tax=Ruania alkalisoli TaxID=2779775 RepID=A0A7M1SUU3_9MICO|nr:hypothetical protein [Ruania alkalisoli]QOR71328.1 hypothetical protein IM660_03225 [Ruania alkalisoli]